MPLANTAYSQLAARLHIGLDWSPPGAVHQSIKKNIQVHSLTLVSQLSHSCPNLVPGEAHIAHVIYHLQACLTPQLNNLPAAPEEFCLESSSDAHCNELTEG